MLGHLLNKKSLLLLLCLLTASLASLAMLFRPAATARASRMKELPRVMLWAWERPARLDFIDPREVGVAFLAKTIFLRGDAVSERPRLQPLSVPQGTVLVAVARIESDRKDEPRLSPAQLAQTASKIADLAQLPNITAVQVDFDAKLSERDFYRALIVELRRRLPEQLPLSITALASWCMHDDWLDTLPLDEAVPMLFRMGVDQRQILSFLATGSEFRSSACRDSRGISTDESPQGLPAAGRTYVFSAEEWSPASVRQIIERSKNEHKDS